MISPTKEFLRKYPAKYIEKIWKHLNAAVKLRDLPGPGTVADFCTQISWVLSKLSKLSQPFWFVYKTKEKLSKGEKSSKSKNSSNSKEL